MKSSALLLVMLVGCQDPYDPAFTGTTTTPGGGSSTGSGSGSGSRSDSPLPSNNCPSGEHPVGAAGSQCVANEVICGSGEFDTCNAGEQCSGGRCIASPGMCATNLDCPVGYTCGSGICVATCDNGSGGCSVDSDCGKNELCVSCQCVSASQCQTATPNLASGTWKAQETLHLNQALGSFGQTAVSILKKARDAINGCPSGSDATCFLFIAVVPFIPDWAQTLIVAVGNFGDLIDDDNFQIAATMTFAPTGQPSSYTVTEHWTLLTFNYQGNTVMEAPEKVPQIGKAINITYGASAVCGVLYIDKHDIDGALSGILNWVINSTVEISTCDNPDANVCYHNLSDAISKGIDCSQVGDSLTQSLCSTFTSGIGPIITAALNTFLANYALLTLKGTATVSASTILSNGLWDGTLGDLGGVFNDFTGTWNATK